jgi:hypothetical protein
VRLAHFAENVAVGDIYVVTVNGTQRFDNVPYKTVSDYLPLDPGTYKIEVRPARAPSTSPAEAALSVTVEAGRAYSVCVWGEGTTVSAMVLNDELSRPPAGEAKVRAINAINGTDGEPLNLLAGGKVLAGPVAPATASDYVSVPAGLTDLSAKASSNTIGTADETLRGGSVYSVAAIGSAGHDDQLLVVDDAAAAAKAPAGGVGTGAGGTAPDGNPNGWRIALCCAAAAVAAVVWRRRRPV